jgi:hypothetical protein
MLSKNSQHDCCGDPAVQFADTATLEDYAYQALQVNIKHAFVKVPTNFANEKVRYAQDRDY